jgi:CTP synthase
MKTKPAQHSARSLMESGIMPDFLVARSEQPVDDVRKEKLALFCNVKKQDVISAPDIKTIYEEPLIFEKQEFAKRIVEKLSLRYRHSRKLDEWQAFVDRINNANKVCKIGIIGKYFDIGDFALEDSYISVIEAIKHACYADDAKPEIHWVDSKDFEKESKKLEKLKSYDGIIVPGGFGSSGVEGKIASIGYARKHNLPFLGLCLGLQLAVVEYARNVCHLEKANSTEMDKKTKYPVIDILPEQRKNIEESNYGATMRLGAWPAVLKAGSVVHSLYQKKEVLERHRHRYEVNPEYIPILEDNGLVFGGRSPDRKLMEFIELPQHKFFVGTQAHPEFKSRPLRPHPLFKGFIDACLS